MCLNPISYFKRLNISRWLWFATITFILLFGVAGVLLFYKIITSEIFWGVFIASFLSFLGSFVLQKWAEEKADLKTQEDKKQELSEVMELIRKEISENAKLAKEVLGYIKKITDMSAQDFTNREKDHLFSRFQLISKESFWKEFAEALKDKELLEKVSRVYSDYRYLNHLLDECSKFVSENLRIGRLHEDYKNNLSTNLWSIQLNNKLAADEGEKISNELGDYIKNTN